MKMPKAKADFQGPTVIMTIAGIIFLTLPSLEYAQPGKKKER